MQDFTGDNLRLNYIHVVKPKWGLSAQVRTRYFNVRVVSPPVREWAVPADFTYSNTPVASGQAYDYSQVNFGIVRAF